MLAAILAWWVVLLLLGQSFASVAASLFARFPDRGLALARPLAMVSLTTFAWLASSFGLPHGRALGLGAIGLAIVWALTFRSPARPPWREQLREEGIFLAILLAVAAVRSLEPAIFGAEKYMDFAFFNTLLRTEHFPPEDPWLAGAAINYYYFGYLLFADLTRLTGVAPEVAYNLSLATVGAVLFTGATSIARALTGRHAFGLLGGLAATWLGNLDGFLQVAIEGKGFRALDYWRSSRVVPNTINEFPFFSLLHGDLHPHLTALTLQVAWIAVALSAWHEASPREALRPLRSLFFVLLLAAIALTNPWDMPVTLALAGLLAVGRWWDGDRPARSVLALATGFVALVAAAMLLALPFSLHYRAPFHGLGRVHAETRLGDFLVVFGLLVLPPLALVARIAASYLPAERDRRDLALAAALFAFLVLYVATGNAVLILTAVLLVGTFTSVVNAEEPEATPALALVAVASAALFACEVVFIRDSYGDELHRMNTVFKLYFQAWTFLALAFPWFARQLLGAGGFRRTAAAAALGAGIAASLFYPIAAVATRAGTAAFTLDGNAYLDRDHPDDAAAIRWLRANVTRRSVILEATGDPYSYFARVSSNTGLPSLLGWANHEGVWRGADRRVSQRRRVVERLYETTDVEEARRLLSRYRVRLVFVGDLEHQKYPAEGLAKFAERPELFTRLFESGGTAIFAVAGGG